MGDVFSVKTSRITHCTLTESADSLISFVVAITLHCCSVAKMAWGPLAPVGRMLTILEVLAPGADCTEVHLARLVADLQKADLDVHDMSLMRVLSWDGQTDITHSLSRTDGLSAPSHLRSGNGARPQSRVFFRCSAIVGLCQSLMQASSSRGRLIWFQESLGQLCVWSREHLEESCGFFRSVGVFAGLTSASVRISEKGFAFAVREGCRDLAAEVGPVRSGLGSGEAPGTSVQGRVLFAPSYWSLFWSVLVRAKM